jgi:hypothetical protein
MSKYVIEYGKQVGGGEGGSVLLPKGIPIFHLESIAITNLTSGIHQRNCYTRSWFKRIRELTKVAANLQTGSSGVSNSGIQGFIDRRKLTLLVSPSSIVIPRLQKETLVLPQEQFNETHLERLYAMILRVNQIKDSCEDLRSPNGYRRTRKDQAEAVLADLWTLHERYSEGKRIEGHWWKGILVNSITGKPVTTVFTPDKNGPRTKVFLNQANQIIAENAQQQGDFLRESANTDYRALGLLPLDPALQDPANKAKEMRLRDSMRLYTVDAPPPPTLEEEMAAETALLSDFQAAMDADLGCEATVVEAQKLKAEVTGTKRGKPRQ